MTRAIEALAKHRPLVQRWVLTLFAAAFSLSVLLALASARPAQAATHIGTTTYTTNTTWTLANSPYILDGNVTVAAAATLTIQPGVVVKLNGQFRSLFVNGTLSAVGTSGSRITFTSYQDDSAGGDSNGDGGATSGARGQWTSIRISSTNNASQLKFVDVRYGAYGSPAWAVGAVDISGGSATVAIEDANIDDNQGSGVKTGTGCSGCWPGATIKRTNLRRNGNGISVNHGWVELSARSFVTDSTTDGVWFNFTNTYAGQASTVMDSDVALNGRFGVEINAPSDFAATRFPHGNRNNVYNNLTRQLDHAYVRRSGIDWTGNYWGDGIDFIFNPTRCYGLLQDSRGHLALLASQSDPPDGPISWNWYQQGSGNDVVRCPYDKFSIGLSEFSRFYLDGTGVPPGQTLGGCRGGLHANRPTVCTSDPVNSATGSLVYEQTDLKLPGIGLPFTFSRTYNSQDLSGGPLGTGWTHSYAAALTIKANGDVTLRGEDGQLVEYAKQLDGSFLGATGALSTLTLSGGVYELMRKDQVAYRFDSAGRLTSMHERNDQGLDFAYDGNSRLSTITDSTGREITLTYNGGGLLTGVALPDGRSVGYGYTNGRLTSVTDVRGNVWTYTYDASFGWLASEVDPNQHMVFRNTYSKWGRVTEQRDALDNSTTFVWDQATQTQTATDAPGNAWKDVYAKNTLVERSDTLLVETDYGYDAGFNVASVTDPRGNATTKTYDSHGNLLTRTAPGPLSYEEIFTYDAQNNLLTASDGRGNTTSFGYDGAGNLTSVTQPGSIVTEYGRDAETGLLVSITDPRDKVTSFDRDSDGNLSGMTSPLDSQATMVYDASGRMSSRVEPRGNVTGADPDDYRTSFTYDDADQLLTASDPLGNTTTRAYDVAGNLSSLTDARSETTAYGYDDADRLISVTAPDSTVTAYGYDEVGNLSSRIDARNNETIFGFDAANRLTSVLSPASKLWTYEYDANGNRTKLVDANGNATSGDPDDGATSYGFDVLDRLTSIDYSDATPDVGFDYDENGNRTSLTDDWGTQSATYDALDRLTDVTRGTDSFSYSYDEAGNVTERIYPDDRTATYTYDDDGRLATVASNDLTTTYDYDAAANLTQTTLPSVSGYLETRTYDRAGRLTEVRNAKSGSTLSFASYDYDAVGNPTTLTTAEGTASYSYDSLDRVTEACYQASCPDPSDPFIRYAYDEVGNRTSEARPAGSTSYSYNAADELTSKTGPGGTVSYDYDENGNETQASSRTFAYDLANRLASMTESGSTITYSYDGDGTRLQASGGGSTTDYLWDANYRLPQLALERDSGGSILRSYLRGAELISMDSGSEPYYFHRDGLGSIVNLTSGSGAAEWTYSYEPFGLARTETQNDSAAPANSIRFAGEQYDSTTSLYHLRARQYDAANGRFLTRDPLEPKLTEPCVSTYVYVKDRPTVFIDPSGMGSVWSGGCDWGKTHRLDRTSQAFWTGVAGIKDSVGGAALAVGGLGVGAVCAAETGGLVAGICLTEGAGMSAVGVFIWWESQHEWEKFWEAVYGDCD
jgi:RHS repeat-associated protein